jgi:hypothetical protein
VLRNVAKYEGLQGLAQLPRTLQAVEKVVVDPVGGQKEAQNTTKAAFSVPELGVEESAKEFFNTLAPSRYFGE